MNNIIPNYTDLSFKFINSNSKLNSLKLVKTYNLLLEKREQDIINQCFDFSFLAHYKNHNYIKQKRKGEKICTLRSSRPIRLG